MLLRVHLSSLASLALQLFYQKKPNYYLHMRIHNAKILACVLPHRKLLSNVVFRIQDTLRRHQDLAQYLQFANTLQQSRAQLNSVGSSLGNFSFPKKSNKLQQVEEVEEEDLYS